MAKFHCPSCSQKIDAGPEFAGATVACPTCGEMITFPAEEPTGDEPTFTEPPAESPPPPVRAPVPRVVSAGTPPPTREQLVNNESSRGCLMLLGTIGAFVLGMGLFIWMAADPNLRGLPGWTPLGAAGGLFGMCMLLMPRRLAGPWKRFLVAQIVAGALAFALGLGVVIGVAAGIGRMFKLEFSNDSLSKVVGAACVGLTLGITGIMFPLILRFLVRLFRIPTGTTIVRG